MAMDNDTLASCATTQTTGKKTGRFVHKNDRQERRQKRPSVTL